MYVCMVEKNGKAMIELTRIICISIHIHFLSLKKQHGFVKLLVRSMDATKCSESLFKGKAKVVDTCMYVLQNL